MAVMKFMAAIFIALITAMPVSPVAAADQVQAREVARMNNCMPKKISVYQQSPGVEGKTLYEVDCVTIKVTDTTAPVSSSALLIGCTANLCDLIRPMAETVAK
jgi:hypothetical protein